MSLPVYVKTQPLMDCGVFLSPQSNVVAGSAAKPRVPGVIGPVFMLFYFILTVFTAGFLFPFFAIYLIGFLYDWSIAENIIFWIITTKARNWVMLTGVVTGFYALILMFRGNKLKRDAHEEELEREKARFQREKEDARQLAIEKERRINQAIAREFNEKYGPKTSSSAVPPRTGGGVHGSASHAIESEIDGPLNGNTGGFNPLFRD